MTRFNLSILLVPLCVGVGCADVEDRALAEVDEDIDEGADADVAETDEADVDAIEPAPAGADDFVELDDPSLSADMACSWSSIADPSDGASVPFVTSPNCGSADSVATSPNAAYGSAACPGRWVTNVTGVAGQPLDFVVRWAGVDLDETTCALASVHASAFGISGGRANLQRVRLDDVTLQGTWEPGVGLMPARCEFEAVGSQFGSLAASHPYHTVRIAAFAQGFLITQPVTAGVRQQFGPC